MSVANQRLLPLTFELVPNLGQAIPNGTVATYRFVDANSGVIESLKPRSGVTKNPLDIRHTFMPTYCTDLSGTFERSGPSALTDDDPGRGALCVVVLCA